MGWAIRRPDGTFRAWNAHTQDDALQPGEVWEERAASPAITRSPLSDAQKDARLDANQAVRALATYFLQRINEERTRHGVAAITPAEALDAVKAIYRGLI